MAEITRTVGDVFGATGLGNLVGGGDGFDLQNALGMANRYQTALDPGQQRALAQAIVDSQKNLAALYGNQQNLAAAFQNQAQGMGPNPAQIMLNQATDKNIAQQAGAIGSIKGINPALAGRLLTQQGAGISQQAAGQGALMGAQQQLQAQNALANLYGNIGQQQIGGISALGGVLNPTQAINAGVASGTQAANQALSGSLLSAAGSAATGAAGGGASPKVTGFSHGGMTGYSQGGMTGYAQGGTVADPKQPKSSVGKFLSGIFEDPVPMNQGGVVNMKAGGEVPGQAKVPGDHIANDTVPAVLSPDEIVIPRSIVLGPNPAKMAAIFVANELKKKKAK